MYIEDKERYAKQKLTYDLESLRLDSGIPRILYNTEEEEMKVGDGRSGLPEENFEG